MSSLPAVMYRELNRRAPTLPPPGAEFVSAVDEPSPGAGVLGPACS